MTPTILLELVEDLQSASLRANVSDVDDDRGGSIKDEKDVRRWLEKHSKWKDKVSFPAPKQRKCGDFILTDDEGLEHVINIKSTKGGRDNVFSKVGFLLAFTNIPYKNLPSGVNLQEWLRLMETRKCDIPDRDYWFLVFSKDDMNNVVIRGSKQINDYKPNADNLLQVDWEKERQKEPCNRSYEKARNLVIEIVRKSTEMYIASLPATWREPALMLCSK